MKKIVILTLILIMCFSSLVWGEDFDEDVFGVLLSDYETGEVLYSKNTDKKLNIASITKLMTYLISMDAIREGKVYYEDIVTIGDNPPKEWGSTFYLKKGEMFKFHTLLEAIMIASANDACVAIAEHVAGTEKEFVKMMNNKAKELGLVNTKYVNTNGLPEDDGTENIMTIREINELSSYILNTYPEVLEITDKRSIEVSTRNYKVNTNPLLRDMPLVDGLKTGHTDGAGYCLVSTINIPKDEENDNYGIDNFKSEKVITREEGIYVELNEAKDTNVKLVPNEDKYIVINKKSKVNTKIILNANRDFPVKKGEKMAVLEVYKNGVKKDSIDLFADEEIKRANIFVRLYRWLIS